MKKKARQESLLQGTPADLSTQIGGLLALDRQREKQRKLFGGLGLAAGIPGCLLTFVFFPIGLPLLALGIGLGVVWNKFAKCDLDETRLQLAQGFLAKLAPDISLKAPVEVTIRHGDAFEHGESLEDRKWGVVRYQTTRDEWFGVQAKLHDHTVLVLEATLCGKRKSRSKRKYTKTKDRDRDVVRVALRVDPQQYPRLAQLPNLLDPKRLTAHTGMTVQGVRVEENRIHLVAVTDPRMTLIGRASHRTEQGAQNRLTPEKLVGLLAFVYGGLTRCGPGS